MTQSDMVCTDHKTKAGDQKIHEILKILIISDNLKIKIKILIRNQKLLKVQSTIKNKTNNVLSQIWKKYNEQKIKI